MFSLAKCKLNEYTAIMQFLVVSLRLPAIILAGFRFHFCASNVFKYTEEKLVKKKRILIPVCIQWNDLNGHTFLHRYRNDKARPRSLLVKKATRKTSEKVIASVV